MTIVIALIILILLVIYAERLSTKNKKNSNINNVVITKEIADYSASKSMKLGAILTKEAIEQTARLDTMNDLMNGKKSAADYFNIGNNKDAANSIEKIYDLCINDVKLKKIVKKYNASIDDFTRISLYLTARGCGWGETGNYVPLSSFAFEITLDHILAHRNNMSKIDIASLLDFFDVKN